MDFKKMQINKEIKNVLQTPFPHYIHKQKDSGKVKLTYVSGSAVIDKLNIAFGYAGWSWDITKQWVQESVDKVNKYPKNEPDKWKYEKQGPVAHVIGTLTVYFEKTDGTIHQVRKSAPGAQVIVGGQSEQENAFKGAHTDALKKAAMMFGIGLELSRSNEENNLFMQMSYENPWSDGAIDTYKNELAYLKNLRTRNNITDEQMNTFIKIFSNNVLKDMNCIVPENIVYFVQFLKAKINDSESVAQPTPAMPTPNMSSMPTPPINIPVGA